MLLLCHQKVDKEPRNGAICVLPRSHTVPSTQALIDIARRRRLLSAACRIHIRHECEERCNVFYHACAASVVLHHDLVLGGRIWESYIDAFARAAFGDTERNYARHTLQVEFIAAFAKSLAQIIIERDDAFRKFSTRTRSIITAHWTIYRAVRSWLLLKAGRQYRAAVKRIALARWRREVLGQMCLAAWRAYRNRKQAKLLRSVALYEKKSTP